MLGAAKFKLEQFEPVHISNTKKSVYDSLIRHVTVEGYPGKTSGFNEANINDLVYAILCPLMFNFIGQQHEQGADCRFLQLKRGKHIGDGESRGRGEFVVIDVFGTGESYVFVVEAKRGHIEEGLTQCLLAM